MESRWPRGVAAGLTSQSPPYFTASTTTTCSSSFPPRAKPLWLTRLPWFARDSRPFVSKWRWPHAYPFPISFSSISYLLLFMCSASILVFMGFLHFDAFLCISYSFQAIPCYSVHAFTFIRQFINNILVLERNNKTLGKKSGNKHGHAEKKKSKHKLKNRRRRREVKKQ